MKKNTRKHESGRSMIEMVGVLAVMGLITAAAFVLITSAMKQQKLSRADDDVAAIVAGVRLLYNNSEYFDGMTDSKGTLKVLGFDTVKSPYGDVYTVGPAPKDCALKCQQFYISFDSKDASTCTALAGRPWPSNGTATCDKSVLTITYDSGK